MEANFSVDIKYNTETNFSHRIKYWRWKTHWNDIINSIL